jgi:hypothetical protein
MNQPNQWVKVNEIRVREIQRILMENEYRSEYDNAPFKLTEIHKILGGSLSEIKRLQFEFERVLKDNFKLKEDLAAEKAKSESK